MDDLSHQPVDEELTPAGPPSYVVGVGASAGGLEALEQLFRAMPRRTGMAFVIVQHLSPDFKSQMYEIVGRWTELDVVVATHEVVLRADTIYLMPPGVEMSVDGGRLLLEERGRGLSLPIDTFLCSCADGYGERSVAIVLSGTGSDGSRGVRAVHAAGGLVIAQSVETAKFDGMPRSALETGVVDLSLTPREIPEALTRYAHDRVDGLASNDSSEAVKLGGMRALFSIVQEEYGIDFSVYKPGTVGRRIERRIMLNQHEDLSDYIERLRSDRSELNALYRDLLIGVTAFFRDPAAFAVLEREVLPSLIADVPRGQELRVWVAGCATGEEAYSIAMLVIEAIEASERLVGAKVFATDVHRSSLELASAGLYPTASVAEVGTERLERFFVREDEGYRVSAELRRMIVFAPHNVVRDAPFAKLDLITCRNMLIYLQAQVQRKVLSLFHFGLRTGGALFLGPSETPGEISGEFETLHQHWKIFRKRRDVRLLPSMREPEVGAPTPLVPSRSSAGRRGPEAHLLDLFGSLLDDALPPSVLVDANHQVIHSFGDISALLRLPRGRPSLGLLDMLDGDFKLAVAGALHRAARVRAPVSFTDVRGARTAEGTAFEIRVRPVELRGSSDPYYLVSLAEGAAVAPVEIPEIPVDLDQVSRDRLEVLEHELRHTKENLQATIEELEASNEELQATNEELLASNEELQSTNEELHSVNEELYTVNAEYQHKIGQLTELTDDMDNLLLSTEVHTLFLDEHLAIRKFTPRMAEVFNLVETDVGRRIDGFVYNIDFEGLRAALAKTLATGERFETEVISHANLTYLMRILPYRGHGRRRGVVMTLVDITVLREAELALREQIGLRDRFLAMLSHELRNPLAAINNSLQLIGRRLEQDSVGVRRPVEVIDRQSRHMQRLLDDLLDVSRVTQGKIHLRKEAVDLCALMRDVVEQHMPQILERGLELERVLSEDAPWIFGDSARIVQILDNLVSNAIKYTNEGGHVRVEVAGEANDGAIVRVRDDGVGIDEQTRARIFEMFVQADSSLDRSQGGLGVGLTLVHQLVELHQGTIEVHSAGVDQGSEFVLRFPRVAHPEQVVASADAAGAEHARAEQPPHIVIVEDRPEIRETLAELLIDSGYQVTTAPDGLRGLETIVELRPRAAVLDIGLPGIDGYELARRLRAEARTAKMPLVAMTGYGRDDDRTRVQDAGFDLHLVKPVDIDEVIAALARLGVEA